MEKIHVIYCTDKNYVLPTVVSAASAIFFSDGNLVLHVIADGVSDDQWKTMSGQLNKVGKPYELVRHKWEDGSFDKFPAWHGSRIIYARLLAQDIIKDIDWAISVDGDTLWLGNPSGMLNERDSSKLYQMSIDPPPTDGGENKTLRWFTERGLNMSQNQYHCVGCMLMNLDALRRFGMKQKAIEFLSKYSDPPYPEQMVMCYLAQGLVSVLQPKWGVFSVWSGGMDLTKGALVHYVQDFPLNRNKLNRLFSDVVMLWFDFCRDILHSDYYRMKFSWWTRTWRRGLFVFLKHNQWILSLHPFIKSRFRNTRGLNRYVVSQLREHWVRNIKREDSL